MFSKIKKVGRLFKINKRYYADEVKNFEFVNLSSTIFIRPNGTLDVQEEFKFLFRGNFSYGMRFFALGESGKCDKISNVKVQETLVNYNQTDDNQAHTFKVTNKNNNLTIINWYYHPTNPEDEEIRSFQLDYNVEGHLIKKKYLQKLFAENSTLPKQERDLIVSTHLSPEETHRLFWDVVPGDFPTPPKLCTVEINVPINAVFNKKEIEVFSGNYKITDEINDMTIFEKKEYKTIKFNYYDKIDNGSPLTVSLPINMNGVNEMSKYNPRWQRFKIKFFDREWREILKDLSFLFGVSMFPFLLFFLLSSGDDESEAQEPEQKMTLSAGALRTLLMNTNDSSSVLATYLQLFEKGYIQIEDNNYRVLNRSEKSYDVLSNGEMSLLFILSSLKNSDTLPGWKSFPVNLDGSQINLIYESINSELIQNNLWNSNLRERIAICNSLTFLLSTLGIAFLARNSYFYSVPLFTSSFVTCLLPEYLINTKTKYGNKYRNDLLIEKDIFDKSLENFNHSFAPAHFYSSLVTFRDQNDFYKYLSSSKFTEISSNISLKSKRPLGNFYVPILNKFSFEDDIIRRFK